MAEHRADTAPVAPPATQAAHPNRAAIRTMLAVGVPAFVALLGILPEVLQVIVDGFGRQLPDDLRLWLLATAASITALSGIITKIMAMPKVLDFTRRYLSWLAPDKSS